MLRIPALIFLFSFLVNFCIAQHTKRALFIGNSYTGTNNLPQMVADIAQSMGDTLVFDSNTPGGYTFQAHSTNPTTLDKIKAGNWDYVVLQEQSQFPSYPEDIVVNYVYPYARFLDSMIHLYSPCARTVFYMTWGRKNGDESNCGWWPPVCTYEGMDSLLYLRYMTMTYANDAAVSPVGAVWKYIRQQFPAIDLYQWDGSHPSVAGTYAGACSFYTAMFKKDPAAIGFDGGLTATDAANIRSAVKQVVYDSLQKWQIGKYDPVAVFNYAIQENRKVLFSNTSINADSCWWDFGDHIGSSERAPVHVFNREGIYEVELTAFNCNNSNSSKQRIVVGDPVSGMIIYPNPTTGFIYISLPDSLINNISICNAVGQQLAYKRIPEGNKVKIMIENYPAGVYFMRVETKERSVTARIVCR